MYTSIIVSNRDLVRQVPLKLKEETCKDVKVSKVLFEHHKLVFFSSIKTFSIEKKKIFLFTFRPVHSTPARCRIHFSTVPRLTGIKVMTVTFTDRLYHYRGFYMIIIII